MGGLRAWFSGLAILLNLVEATAVWPQGLLDARICDPKADGDSTPLGQRPLKSNLWCTSSELPSGLVTSRIGFRQSFLWMLGFRLLLILMRSCLERVGISCTSWSLMSLNLVTRSIGLSSIVLSGVLVCPPSLGRFILLTIIKSVFGLRLAAGLGEPWCRDGGIPQGCPPEYGLYCRLVRSLV